MGKSTPFPELKDRTYRVLRGLYEFMPEPREAGTSLTGPSAERLAETIDVSKGLVEDHFSLFRHLGILKQEITYPGRGRVAVWTLLTDLGGAYKLLDRHFTTSEEWLGPDRRSTQMKSSGNKKQSTKEERRARTEAALRLNGEEWVDETVAIVGPDAEQPMAALAPVRKDEGAALIEAARQYRNRGQAVQEAINQLRGAGLEVNAEALTGSVTLPVDERLDAVVDVLDYVEQLERDNKRLIGLANERLELARENGTLKQDLRRQQEANARMAERYARERVAGGAQA